MDDWEDWDDQDYCVTNKEQLKLIQERKLVEESDNALTKYLFEEDLAYEEVNTYKQTSSLSSTEKKAPEKKQVSKKEANEQKQKEISKMIKNYKSKKERERELFGEAAENEYSQYEDMFY